MYNQVKMDQDECHVVKCVLQLDVPAYVALYATCYIYNL